MLNCKQICLFDVNLINYISLPYSRIYNCNEIYNIIDYSNLSKKKYMRNLIKLTGPSFLKCDHAVITNVFDVKQKCNLIGIKTDCRQLEFPQFSRNENGKHLYVEILIPNRFSLKEYERLGVFAECLPINVDFSQKNKKVWISLIFIRNIEGSYYNLFEIIEDIKTSVDRVTKIQSILSKVNFIDWFFS